MGGESVIFRRLANPSKTIFSRDSVHVQVNLATQSRPSFRVTAPDISGPDGNFTGEGSGPSCEQASPSMSDSVETMTTIPAKPPETSSATSETTETETATAIASSTSSGVKNSSGTGNKQMTIKRLQKKLIKNPASYILSKIFIEKCLF
jgi:hypothetical protein